MLLLLQHSSIGQQPPHIVFVVQCHCCRGDNNQLMTTTIPIQISYSYSVQSCVRMSIMWKFVIYASYTRKGIIYYSPFSSIALGECFTLWVNTFIQSQVYAFVIVCVWRKKGKGAREMHFVRCSGLDESCIRVQTYVWYINQKSYVWCRDLNFIIFRVTGRS